MQAAGLPGWASLIIESLDSTQSQWVAQGPLSEMLKPGLGEEVAERVRTIAARIALSAALLLTDPAQLSQASKLRNPDHRRGIVTKKAQRGSSTPAVKRYVLAEAVSVDLREIVGEYIRHGGGHPKVRMVVCGHYEFQAYGPKHSLRKHIWVKPYVRGAQFADQVVRRPVIKVD